MLPARDGLLQMRIVEGHERTLAELPDKEPEPDAAHSNRSHKVHPAHAELPVIDGRARSGGARRDEPEEVYEAHQEHDPCDESEAARITLQVARQEQQKRQPEMKDDH